MTNKIKISSLSITSLVFGLLFFIPLLAGILAIVFGFIAKAQIKKSHGRLLGGGMGLSGIILGIVQVLLWSLILFSGTIYVIKDGQEAVVMRSNHIARLEKPGIHFKVPFLEKIEIFPVGDLFIYQAKGIRVLSTNKRLVNIDVSVNWKICDSLSALKTFSYYDEKRIDVYLHLKLEDTLKRVATAPDVTNMHNLSGDYELTQRIERDLQKKLDGHGICIYNLKLSSTEER